MKASLRLTVVAVVLTFMLSGSAVRAEDPKPKGKEQVWEGTLKVAPGVELRLVIRASVSDGAPAVATLDSPDEGFKGLILSSVVSDQSRLAFELKVSNAKFEGKLAATWKTMSHASAARATASASARSPWISCTPSLRSSG